MDYAVSAPELAGRKALVRVRGIFADPQLVVDGAVVPATGGGGYAVPSLNPTGTPLTVRLRTPWYDVVPTLTIGDQHLAVAPPLAPGQLLWCALPTLLLTVAGHAILPTLLGIVLSYYCVYLLRVQAPAKRYVATGLVILGTIVLIGGFVLAHWLRSRT